MYSYGPSIMSEALPNTQPKINETYMEKYQAAGVSLRHLFIGHFAGAAAEQT